MAEDIIVQKNKGATQFCSLVVLEFSSSTPLQAIEWLVGKITTPKEAGGGSLQVKTVKDEDTGRCILHIGATTERLLIAAELMELKKEYRDGTMREICMADLEHFYMSENLDRFLTNAEKQRIILHELESIRALESENIVPGLTNIKLYRGEAMVAKLKEKGRIEKLFPLHDKIQLRQLGEKWYQRIFSVQPIHEIQNYFGDTIAMYFAFLGFYTMALIPPALIGLFFFFFSVWKSGNLNLIVFFSIFNLVWVTVSLESWKRNCATLAYKWGTINTEHFEEARASYHGDLGLNKITGRLEPKYPKWKRVFKFYFVSLPVVFSCLMLALLVMLLYFKLEEIAIGFDANHKTTFSGMMKLMPTVIYALLIVLMNAIYRKLAKALNDWENHRLESAYENHLITKLVLFDFVNCFMSLFYVAFYLQDMVLLRSHLAALLITQQILGQVQESLLPYLMYKRRKSVITKKQKKYHENVASGVQPLAPREISSEEIDRREIESSKDLYPTDLDVKDQSAMMMTGRGTIDDYLEMFLQFGYVYLFSAVFPSAAFWALINNITEIRTDAFKLCRIFQRPFARPCAGIGAWQIAFEMMSVMAVMTNCALVAMNANVQKFVPDYGEGNVILLFVFAEHGILFIKAMLAYLIPDEPRWVETALAKAEYDSKQAWRKQRALEAQQHFHNIAQSFVVEEHDSPEDGVAELGTTEKDKSV